ncbi:hypothetical protein O181_026816 [Austropuccinia psidii MF-1]|uniref:Uncharacterized protein n=1 Tax=Austropuccinia psidii MF-1 TaxID=1389203 RepID=A0A9Q3CR80_9BASI|nr:hypothetical protein [Austropuccinia psidii MF-1]
MGVCSKYSLNPFYGQLLTSLVLWSIGPFWCFMAFGPYHLSLDVWPQAKSCSHWPFWPIIHLINTFVLGLGGHPGPSSLHHGLRPNPFDHGVSGHKPQCMGLLGPFWPNSNEANHWSQTTSGPQSQYSQKFPKGPQDPNWPRTTFWPLSTPGLWQPPEATSSSPESFPLHSGEVVSFTNGLCTKDSGVVHIWYNISLCTNFAQRSNGDVSGPNYAFQIQVPKSITQLKGSLFSHSVLQYLAATRGPFEDPNHLALQELGGIFFLGSFQG